MKNTGQLIIVMGVSGSGKSSIAEALSTRMNIRYEDADDFHSPSAKVKMASGISITDTDRLPWIHRLCTFVHERVTQGESLVIACSLLRRAHRQMFYNLGIPLTVLYLNGEKALIQERMQKRKGHFFPVSLLDSQFNDLEPPLRTEPVITLEINKTVNEIVSSACKLLKERST